MLNIEDGPVFSLVVLHPQVSRDRNNKLFAHCLCGLKVFDVAWVKNIKRAVAEN